LAVVKKLRDPVGGCPWDKEQSHLSLTPYIIEESFEVVDVIEQNKGALHEELGDVLLQIALHSEIASEQKTFTMTEVIRTVCDKMVRRHPHVFGDTVAATSSAVLENWERLKQKELKSGASILDGVPLSLPALLRAQRSGEKAARVGFDWSNWQDVLNKVREELSELERTLSSNGSSSPRTSITTEEEFGDLLFALAQLARFLNLQAESALRKAVEKFTRRFKEIEREFNSQLKGRLQSELDAAWERIKARERASLPSKMINFAFHAPQASGVVIAGTFNNWSQDTDRLERGPDGVWRTTIELKPGRYEYRFVVDGQWENDQNPVELVANQSGGFNCVVEVS
jgi:MazG family protein